MKIDSIDIRSFDAKQLTVDFEPPQTGVTVEMFDGALIPSESETYGENKFKDVSLMEFPYLTTGQEKEHHLIFSDNNALVTLQYKPMWL